MPKSKVIFLCTGNSARSQMAEGLLRAMAGEHFEVFSAGTEPKGGILPEVREAMREIGIDLSDHWSKSVTEYLGKKEFAHVLTVCADAEENCPAVLLTMGMHEHWPFDDPASAKETDRLPRTRAVRDQIEARLLRWLGSLGIQPRDFRLQRIDGSKI